MYSIVSYVHPIISVREAGGPLVFKFHVNVDGSVAHDGRFDTADAKRAAIVYLRTRYTSSSSGQRADA